MADTTADARSRAGSVADRKVPLSTSTAIGAGLSLVIGAADWLAIDCTAGGHWHLVQPSKTLVEMAATILIFPLAHFGARVANLIARKILKALGDTGE